MRLPRCRRERTARIITRTTAARMTAPPMANKILERPSAGGSVSEAPALTTSAGGLVGGLAIAGLITGGTARLVLTMGLSTGGVEKLVLVMELPVFVVVGGALVTGAIWGGAMLVFSRTTGGLSMGFSKMGCADVRLVLMLLPMTMSEGTTTGGSGLTTGAGVTITGTTTGGGLTGSGGNSGEVKRVGGSGTAHARTFPSCGG